MCYYRAMERKNLFTKGNQRARKHGFYSKALDDFQKKDFEKAISVEGLDEEVALLRVKIKSLIEHDPDNLKLLGQAVKILAGLVTVKYNIRKEDKSGILDAVANVLHNGAVPLSILASFIKK